jgi:hypothetical protein
LQENLKANDMKQRIRILINYFLLNLKARSTAISVHDNSIFFAVFIALIKLKSIKNKNENNKYCLKYFMIDFSSEINLLESRFPYIMKVFFCVKNRLPNDLLVEVFQKIQEVFEYNDDDADDVISWSYQFIKRDSEKVAFKKIGSSRNKIKGQDLLFTTQFFTDKYMVKFLVDQTLSKITKENITNVTVVDSASGGGNFLIYSFEFLYKLYKKFKPTWSNQKIVDYILSKNIIGYDLDRNLAQISTLSLYVKASNYAIPKSSTPIYIFEGMENDVLGFLNKNDVLSNKIEGQSLSEKLNQLNEENSVKFYLMNPPFMGKRDMEIHLKNYLMTHYPLSKGDLCASFIYRLLEIIQPHDIIGLVAQNNWMYLSSFKEFRKYFLNNLMLNKCVDLGSNAFEDINGEKTNVGLFIISKVTGGKSTFNMLRYKSLPENKDYLNKNYIPKELVFKVDQKIFLKNKNHEFYYQLGNRFENLLNLKRYSEFGKPMQGTSTGNNLKFVKFAWEVNGSPDWRLVSKGGGFSKWSGLNFYKVLWGKNGELVAANEGSAMRNLDKISSTQLVFSDTGTLGLNVRVLKDNQVFIASGPGIQVLNGDKYAHLAFLNSRVATFLIKLLNPKFTISAGYISMIPVDGKILNSKIIAGKSKKCLNLKESYLKSKLPNFEFEHIDYLSIKNLDKWIDNQIIKDLESDYARLTLEFEIEKEIRKHYNFNNTELQELKQIVGESPFFYKKRKVDLKTEVLDDMICRNLDINCFSTSRKINGYSLGSESVFEDISYKLTVHPDSIMEIIRSEVGSFYKTRNKYINDLIHKIILFELGVKKISIYKFEIHDVNSFINRVRRKYKFLNKISGFESRIENILTTHHRISFLNKPLIVVSKKSLKVGEIHE